MRDRKSGNVMLVVNAVLLVTLAVGYVGGSPFGSRAVSAAAPPKGPMNAAAQRLKMIKALDEMNKNTKASMELQRQLVRLLERGDARIEVTNLDEIQILVAGKSGR